MRGFFGFFKKIRGEGRNRTDEYSFCRAVPYHLATPPKILSYLLFSSLTPSSNRSASTLSRRHQNLIQPMPIHIHHLIPMAPILKDIPLMRNPRQMMHNKSTQRLIIPI